MIDDKRIFRRQNNNVLLIEEKIDEINPLWMDKDNKIKTVLLNTVTHLIAVA